MKRILIIAIALFAIMAAVALAHTSRGTLVCPDANSTTPTLRASITGDSFPAGHHVSVSLRVIDNGVTIQDGIVVADSGNGNQTFGPFTVARQGAPDSVAHATATFTIHDKTENHDYIGTASFEGKCGTKPTPPPVPPTPPTPPVPPIVPPAPPTPPVVPPAPPVPPKTVPKCEHRANGVIVCKKKPHRCTGYRLPRVVKHGPHKGQRYTICYHPPKRKIPHFTG